MPRKLYIGVPLKKNIKNKVGLASRPIPFPVM